ncbi:MAG: hypothetical protein JWR03_96 [Cohnella sp.]|nr:hypothetical protein [Cohnella sp.]
MNVTVFISMVAIVMGIGLIATLVVGFSRANKEGDPNYEHKTGSKLTRLTFLYIAAVIIAVSAFVIFLNR